MALTVLAIKNFKPKDKVYRVADSGGLCLEITPAGGKHWRWRFKRNGKSQLVSLGSFPITTLEQARKLRDEARQQVHAGKHPTREKKALKLRRTHEADNTFEAIAKHWLANRQGLNAKYSKQCQARMAEHVFPMIGALPISQITIPDVVKVVEKIGNRGTVETAKRMKQLIGQVFRYAAQRGMCQHNPAADLKGILPSPQEKHHACIHPRELPTLLNAIEARDEDMTKVAMKLLALTFVRTGELIGATWAEINWEKEEWHIPKERMKMKRPHTVPLSTQALALLKTLHTRTGHKTHVFHSAASKGLHMSNGAILMALRRMGYQGRMTGHGFRTLASTILNEKGYAPDVIERQLAHEDSDKIRAAYNRAEYLLERKKMMQEYADFLEVVRTQDGENVLALTKQTKTSA